MLPGGTLARGGAGVVVQGGGQAGATNAALVAKNPGGFAAVIEGGESSSTGARAAGGARAAQTTPGNALLMTLGGVQTPNLAINDGTTTTATISSSGDLVVQVSAAVGTTYSCLLVSRRRLSEELGAPGGPSTLGGG